MAVIAVPDNIDFTLTTAITKILYTNMEISDFSGKVKIKDSRASLTDVKMKTLGGTLGMNGSYDTKNVNSPKVDLKLDIAGFDITKTSNTFVTVQKLAPIAKCAKGQFSTKLDFVATLDKKMQPDLKSLTGGGKLQTKTVVIEGFGPMEKLADALKNDKLKKASFSDLDITYHFVNGRVVIDPFDFKLGDVKGKIAGSNGFDQTINYVWDMQVPLAAAGSQANDVLNGLVSQANSKGAKVSLSDNINLQAIIEGTVTKPSVRLGFKDAGKNAMDDLKAKAKDELDKQKKVLEDKAKAAVDSLKKEGENKAKAEADRVKKQLEDQAKKAADDAKKKLEDEAKNKLKGLFK